MPPALRAWGWVGVDLFLVLSAFLLTRLLVSEFEGSGRVNLRSFFLRRALRIWPLHWGFVSAMLLGVWIEEPAALAAAAREWLTHVAFFNNFDAAFSGQFSKALPFTAHLWTISLEEQFYLVVPFAIPLVARLRSRALRWGLLGTVLAALCAARASAVEAGMPHPFIWALPLRADALVMGAALGAASGYASSGSGPAHASKGADLWVGLGIALLCGATWLPPIDQLGWGQVFAYPVVDIGCLLLVLGALEGGLAARFLGLQPLRYLGKISFGIYVYHVAISHSLRAWLRGAGLGEPWLVFAVTLVATCIAAAVSYEIFEKPFLRWKERFTRIPSRPL